jgi:uncharacterized cupin superfamily protein
MPKIDIAGLPIEARVNYPDPFAAPIAGREKKRLGNAVGIDQFGVNLMTLKPGSWSSQRHWQHTEDEMVFVVSGEVVLCEDSGETVLKAGEAAGWKSGVPNGHCLINRTGKDVVVLEIGTRHVKETVTYSDIDMMMMRDENGPRYQKKSGEPYPKRT